jgi:hypothetical protein
MTFAQRAIAPLPGVRTFALVSGDRTATPQASSRSAAQEYSTTASPHACSPEEIDLDHRFVIPLVSRGALLYSAVTMYEV